MKILKRMKKYINIYFGLKTWLFKVKNSVLEPSFFIAGSQSSKYSRFVNKGPNFLVMFLEWSKNICFH